MKKSMKKCIVTFVLLALVMTLIPKTPLHAASKFVLGFPLPVVEGKIYYVTALQKYGDGTRHGSYLDTYTNIKHRDANAFCVLDIAATRGTEILAVDSGVVVVNAYASGGGNYLVILHDDGSYSYYGHMESRSSFTVGTTVSAGTTIGLVSDTGRASGPHLHYERSDGNGSTHSDPYCEFSQLGLVKTKPGSPAEKYTHNHNHAELEVTVTTGDITNASELDFTINGSFRSTKKASEIGVYAGYEKSDLRLIGKDKVSSYGCKCWYSWTKFSSQPRYSGGILYYQTYVLIDGEEYRGDIRSYVLPTTSVKTADPTDVSLKKLSAKLSGSYANIKGVTACGVLIGKNAMDMNACFSDQISLSNANMWYHTGLNNKYPYNYESNNTYYYCAYVKTDKGVIFGDLKSLNFEK